QRWYTLAIPVIQEQSSPLAKPKMQTVVVKVYFAGNERNLPTRPAYYSVEGVGEITVDGSLLIRNAKTLSVSQKKPAPSREAHSAPPTPFSAPGAECGVRGQPKPPVS